MKTDPLRTCIVCKSELPKTKLLRLVRINNCIQFDFSYKLSGRGAYVCPQTGCIKGILKKGILDKHLKLEVATKEASNILAYLTEYIKQRNDEQIKPA